MRKDFFCTFATVCIVRLTLVGSDNKEKTYDSGNRENKYINNINIY